MSILIVGEAYGKTEEEKDTPFVGRCGTYLRDFLAYNKIDAEFTNVCNFRPLRGGKTVKPTPKQIAAGRDALFSLIGRIRPSLIIGLGTAAMHGLYWGGKLEDNIGINRLVGYTGRGGVPAYVAFTYHPSYALRFKKEEKMEADILRYVQYVS